MADFNESIRAVALGSVQMSVATVGADMVVDVGAGMEVGGIAVGAMAVAGRTVEVGKRIGVGVSG